MSLGEPETNSPTATQPDTTLGVVTVRYNIAPGDHYRYNLVTDQVIVNKHSTRLQATFDLIAISRDEQGNSTCRIKLSSDVKRDSSALHADTESKRKRFAGYRGWSQERDYAAVIDALGRILSSSVVSPNSGSSEPWSDANAETMTERVTQFTGAPEDDPATPELMSFILPAISTIGSLAHGSVWYDTSMIASKSQFAAPIKHGQTTAPVIEKDTLFRTTRVDSVATRGGRQHCFFSRTTERRNTTGSLYVTSTTLQRDVSTGIVIALSEKTYRVVDNERILYYTASAVLVPEMSTALLPTKPRTREQR